MANTLLTSTVITRKALQILHQKCNVIGKCDRQYDGRFAQDGGKIGSTLEIRLPNQYVVGTGAAITPQDTTEQKTVLTVATQKHVPMEFFSTELTMSLDDFSERIIDPAMSVLASNAEADVLTMSRDVWQQVGTPGTAPATALAYLTAMSRLTNSLTPSGKRCYHIKPEDMAVIVDALKGLFNSTQAISDQYRDGVMGRGLGGDWYENTLMDRMTNGNKVASVTVSGAGQTGSAILLGGLAGSDTFKRGQVFTMAGVFEVHHETKISTGKLQKFVVTSDVTSAGATLSIPIAPAIVTSGALQTVSASPANGAAIVFDGSANATYGLNLAWHKNAFAVVFADLDMPKGLDFAHRETMDNISMRILRQYEARTDKWVTRADILYGYKAVRPQFACRIASD